MLRDLLGSATRHRKLGYLKFVKSYQIAKIPNGVLGSAYGKIGPVVTYEWKDIPCMRTLPSPSNQPPSDAQVKCRTRFAYASTFLSPMKALIKETFKEYASRMTEFNNAVSYTTKNAISGSYPDFRIHYDRLLLSRGSLPNADEPMAQEDNGFLHFSWKDNSGLGKAAATDKALLICYIQGFKGTYHTTEAAVRGDET
ncbi:MAG: hypothetical protein JST39_08700, partial [Bacteroidetes bacterium]|nr:hypothetical protein [Bacteroidota bacterium]